MDFITESRSFFVKFVFRNFTLLLQNDVTGLLVSEFAGSKIFRKEIDARIKIPRATRLVIRFRHLVSLFTAFDVVDSGIKEILRDRRLANFFVVKVDNRAGRFGGDRQSAPNAVTTGSCCDKPRTDRR